MTTEPDIHVRITEYEVSVLPEGDINRPSYTLKVAYRGRDRWAVTHYCDCLSADGTWDYEMRPSERTDEWINEHRFDLGTALQLAKKAAPDLHCNGHTAVEVWRLTQDEQTAADLDSRETQS